MTTTRSASGVVNIDNAVLGVLGKEGLTTSIDLFGTQILLSTVIVQNLYNPNIEMSMTISEGKGHLTSFNQKGLQGQEFVAFKATKPGLEDPTGKPAPTEVDLQFWCRSVEDISFGDKGDTQTYQLNCLTKESILNAFSSVNQSYSTSYSNTANSIFVSHIQKNSIAKKYFKDYGDINLETRSFDTHDSKLVNDFVIPGLKPFNAIDMCARRSFIPSSFANLWTFYQDFDGYHFYNIEQLIKDGKEKADKDPENFVLEYNVIQDKESSSRIDRQVHKISGVEGSDTYLNSGTGTFKNTVRSIDIIGQTYTDTAFNYNEKFGKFEHLGGAEAAPLADKFWVKEFTQSNYEHLYIKDTSKQNQYFEQVLGHRLPYFISLNNLKCEVTTDADLFWKPGQVVVLSIQEMTGFNNKSLEEHKFAGYWLIENVTHIINSAEAVSVLSLVKDSTSNVVGSGEPTGDIGGTL